MITGKPISKIDFALLAKINGSKNLGLNTDRLEYSNSEMERAFSETWQEENEKKGGINKGNGILQDHFIADGLCYGSGEWYHTITNMERFIVATIIQWLGTNCGRAFLEKVLKKCGYRIIKID